MDKDVLFKNDEEAFNLLSNSRKEIDEIDNKLIDLISLRTSIAKNIVQAKIFLGMDIHDKAREELIQNKVTELALEKNLDIAILNKIMNMLMVLSKNKQKEILKEEC